jgi:hypothetical protein
MDDGTVVKTENATQSWDEATRWDGHNRISMATESQWEHQTLYRSRKGRYYVEHTSQWQGSTPHAEWVSNHEAAHWLAANGIDLPVELATLEYEAIIEKIKADFGPTRRHMAFRQIASAVRPLTERRIAAAAHRCGVKIESKPARFNGTLRTDKRLRLDVYVALPLNGVTGFREAPHA